VALFAAGAVFLAAVAAGYFDWPWLLRTIVRPLQALRGRLADRR